MRSSKEACVVVSTSNVSYYCNLLGRLPPSTSACFARCREKRRVHHSDVRLRSKYIHRSSRVPLSMGMGFEYQDM